MTRCSAKPASVKHDSNGFSEIPARTGRQVKLPVDGYWPAANLIVEYRELQHDRRVPHFDKPQRLTVSGVHGGIQRALHDARRDELISVQGIRLMIITPQDLDATPRGRLRRNTHPTTSNRSGDC